jgi:hypothetical protein
MSELILQVDGRQSGSHWSVGETCMVRRRTARRIGCDENSLRKCIRPLVETGLRAHDDDSRVPVLVNRHGRKRPRFDTGFQARRLTVFSSFLSSADS